MGGKGVWGRVLAGETHTCPRGGDARELPATPAWEASAGTKPAGAWVSDVQPRELREMPADHQLPVRLWHL